MERDMWMNRKLVLVIGVMIAATLACGPIDLARDILGRLPTVCPLYISDSVDGSLRVALGTCFFMY
jgi:hypothetical protein